MPKPCGIMSAPNQALEHARGDQHPGAGAIAQSSEADGEAGDADHEQPPAAEQVAEPGAGDQPTANASV